MKLNIGAFKKISWKLTLIYALIFSSVLVLLNAGTLFGLRYLLIEQVRSQVESSAASAASLVAPRLGQKTAASKLLVGLKPAAEMSISVTDPRGKVVASAGNSVPAHIGPISDPGATAVVETNDMHLVIQDVPLASDGKIAAYLRVVYDMRREYFFLKALFALMAAADAAGVVISVFAGILISRRILKPIDRITRAAKSISVSDLNSRIEVGEADDELARLAVTFNEMIERLRNSFERQSRFVSDASHELRTPIAVIRGYADVVYRWGKNDAEVLEESITAIKRETDDMSALVERLLFLARGESGGIKLQAEKFDAGELAAEVVGESLLIAPDRKIEYFAEAALMTADRKLIKQLLRALVENSVKFTSPGGKIKVNAFECDSKVIFTVADDGIGIPQEEIGHIFDRFYVVDKARSKEKGGSGLGLSIVKWIVDAHGGNIFAKSPETGGTVFTAEFPQDLRL